MADLVVRQVGTNEEVARIKVASLAERSVERVVRGMYINMRADCWIDESEVEAEREQTTKSMQ